MDSPVVITANGEGSRMKCLSQKPKHHLYYRDKKIIDHLKELFPQAEVLEGKPSQSRRDSLEYIRHYKDCLIIDCDIIPDFKTWSINEDFLYYFNSNKDKYGSIITDKSGKVLNASERKNISQQKTSGVYFVKSVSDLIDRMQTDSIAEAMIGAKAVYEDSFIRLGDPQDYYEAMGIKGGSFTGNRITMNERTVIKHCSTGLSEASWYKLSCMFNTPSVRYVDEEMIITERIYPTSKPDAQDFIKVIEKMQRCKGNGKPFETYLSNLPVNNYPTPPEHEGSFFHGDLSTHNVLKNSRVWLIDPNYKSIFGSWLTDAGKAVFSLIAYEMNYPEAKKIVDYFGKDVLRFAVTEGLRVCKYRPEYTSTVNNINDLV
jgi:hypothetical protein